MELHTRSTEANGFDRTARHGRTGHKERSSWLVGSFGFERTMTIKPGRARLSRRHRGQMAERIMEGTCEPGMELASLEPSGSAT